MKEYNHNNHNFSLSHCLQVDISFATTSFRTHFNAKLSTQPFSHFLTNSIFSFFLLPHFLNTFLSTSLPFNFPITDFYLHISYFSLFHIIIIFYNNSPEKHSFVCQVIFRYTQCRFLVRGGNNPALNPFTTGIHLTALIGKSQGSQTPGTYNNMISFHIFFNLFL